MVRSRDTGLAFVAYLEPTMSVIRPRSARRLHADVLAQQSTSNAMLDLAEAAGFQHAQDRLRRHTVRDGVPVVLHQELGLRAAGAEPGHARKHALEIEAEEALAKRRARQGDLKDQDSASRFQDAQQFSKG